MPADTPSGASAAASFAVEAGMGGLSRVVAVAADGARVEAYLHGAHVTSWQPAGAGGERLFVSARSRFGPDAAIRGGVPLCFPQFASQGTLPMHGFARTATWDLVHARRSAAGAAELLLRLTDSEAMRALWPHSFVAELSVTAAGGTLGLCLDVHNTGPTALAFTGALHTYLRVADVAHATVHGLRGAGYRDKVKGTDGETEAADALRVVGPIDRVYYAAPANLELREPARTLAIAASGFADTVVWNPGAAGGAAMADMEPDGYARMVCVEAAAAREPVTVAPGAHWRGTQTLTAR
jgi:glucose-6-phosphate 1-epimerase